MRAIPLKIAPGATEEIAIDGDYVRVKTASVAVRIRDENSNVDATLDQGDALNLKPFKRLRVSHSDAADQSITLMIGNGTSADSAKVGGSVSVSALPVANAAFTESMPVLTAGVSSAMLPANAARKSLIVINPTGATIYVNVAGNAASTFSLPILPGGSLILDSGSAPRGAVNGYSAGGAVAVVLEGA